MAITKEDILQEIHKFVAERKEAPGELQFKAVTRIKPSAWKGRYWVRWTEAVREAGYDPQSMVQRTPDETIIENLAEYIGRLGHFPVRDEINLESRKLSGIPTWTTLKRRYSGMSELAAALLKFSRQKGDLKVAVICEERLIREQKKPVAASHFKPPIVEPRGIVYLAYSPSLRLFKIGMAEDGKKRIARISLLLPDDLIPKHEIETDYPSILERFWHQRFSSSRRQGEWFDLSSSDVDCFKARRFFMFEEFFPKEDVT